MKPRYQFPLRPSQCVTAVLQQRQELCKGPEMCPLFSPVCVDVTVTFNPQNYTVTEGDPAPLMIILDKPAAKDITVTVTTMDITAEGEQANCSCSK